LTVFPRIPRDIILRLPQYRRKPSSKSALSVLLHVVRCPAGSLSTPLSASSTSYPQEWSVRRTASASISRVQGPQSDPSPRVARTGGIPYLPRSSGAASRWARSTNAAAERYSSQTSSDTAPGSHASLGDCGRDTAAPPSPASGMSTWCPGPIWMRPLLESSDPSPSLESSEASSRSREAPPSTAPSFSAVFCDETSSEAAEVPTPPLGSGRRSASS